MGKTKKKSMSKILDRMLRRGHAWKWLELVEKEGLKDSYAKERREAWKTVTQRAFRSPEAFEEFFCNARGLADRPDDLPGLAMLGLLKDFVEGRGADTEGLKRKIASISVASLPLEPLKQRVSQWRDGAAPAEAKLRKALDAFIARPGSVTRRHVDELSLLLAAAGLNEAVGGLGPHINAMRRLNHKTTARKGLGWEHFAALAGADRKLEEASRLLPVHLFQAVERPFLHQAAALMARLKRRGKVADAADAAGSMPFILHALTGQEAEEISKRLAPYARGGDDDVDAADKDACRQVHRARTQPIEEKAALLGRLRKGLRKGLATDRQRSAFRMLYEMLLSDIEEKSASLDKRQQAEVARILAPLILLDIVLCDDGEVGLAGLLLSAAKAGCLDVRLALLSMIVGSYEANAKIEAAAGRYLALHPPPTTDDFSRALKTARSLHMSVFPEVSILAPMIELYGDESPIAQFIQHYLRREFDILVSKMLAANGMTESDLLFGASADETELEDDFFFLREELERAPVSRAFPELFGLASCFPDGPVTRKTYVQYLSAILGLDRGLFFIIFKLDDLDRLIAGPGAAENPLWAMLGGNTAIDEAQLCMETLAMKKAIESADLPILEKLAALLARATYGGRPREKLLAILTKVLDRRLDAGEQEAGAIRDRLLGSLAWPTAKVKRKGDSRRKRGW